MYVYYISEDDSTWHEGEEAKTGSERDNLHDNIV